MSAAAGPSDLSILRVGNGKIFEQEVFRRFLLRAVEMARLPGPALGLYHELQANIDSPSLLMLLGLKGRRPKAVFVGMLPLSCAMMAPQALLVYSELPALSRLLGARVRSWLKEAQQERIIGMNLNHSDKAFLRACRPYGTAKVIGSLIEVRL